jgi:hypothetical protein
MEFLKLFQNHEEYETFVSGGTMVKPNVSHCINENEVHYNPIPHDYKKDYFTIESLEDNNTIYLKATNTAITKTVSASTDNGETWTEYTSSTENSGTTLATLNKGDKLLVKGENSAYATYSYSTYNQFKTTGQFEVKGNIMSLIGSDSFVSVDELTESQTFAYLFYQCTGLTSAENLSLPATTLADSCYYYMFTSCKNLTTAPELPATTLASSCYNDMFNGCTSLTSAPELPATALTFQCYRYMFYGCTSLVTAPELHATTLAQHCCDNMFSGCRNLTTAPELHATSLETNCYSYMFKGCTSLVNAPELPATSLNSNCYQSMFEGCTSLVNAPELPATTLVTYCYREMFRGCTGLVTAPELPATTLVSNCYTNMFYGCTGLNYIKAMFTTTPSGTYTNNWVYNVAATGTFVKNVAAEWDASGASSIPNGWTVQTASA